MGRRIQAYNNKFKTLEIMKSIVRYCFIAALLCFTMTVSALSMFLFRIIMAYVFVYVFKTGVIAIWYAMVLDWIIRSLVFVLRYKSGKWEKNHVI